ncbi:MAG: GNAT family N-acetyltransferase [Sulfobacillus thermotolerans]|nr:GNAT family N-acetyltransferase [Sulfobacillus thermotolerans]
MDAIRVKRAAPDDLGTLGEMVDRIYRPQKPPGEGMPREFPHLFDPRNAANLFFVEDRGRPVSMVGVLKQIGMVPGAAVPVASIGSVATVPEYRGLHLASRILQVVFDTMRDEQQALCLISGDRDLYLRQGAIAVGQMETVFIELTPSMPRLSYPLRQVPAHLRASYASRLIRLYRQEPYRFMRTTAHMEVLLNALWFQRPGFDQQLFVIGPEDHPVAYVVVYVSARSIDQGTIMEWAGDRAAIVQALPYVMTHMNIRHLQFHIHEADFSMHRLADEKGWTLVPGPLQGTVKVVNEDVLRSAYRAWLAEYEPWPREEGDWGDVTARYFGRNKGQYNLPLMLTDDLNYI